MISCHMIIIMSHEKRSLWLMHRSCVHDFSIYLGELSCVHEKFIMFSKGIFFHPGDGKTKEKYRKKNVGRNNSFPLLKLFSVSFSVPMHSFIRSMLWGSLLFCITSRTAGAAALNSWLSWLWSRELPSPLLSESSFRESPKVFIFSGDDSQLNH